MSSRRNMMILLAGALAAMAVMLILALSPGPVTIDTKAHDADIFLSANRRWVVNVGNCVTVRWNVQNIEAVLINDTGRIGQDKDRFCVEDLDGLTLTMEVHYVDGTRGGYSLKVGLMSKAPEIWALVVIALTLSVVAVLLVIIPRVPRRLPHWSWRRAHWLSWLGILALSLLITLLGLEIGLRFYFTHRGTPSERAMYVFSIAEIRQSSTESVLPFLNFGLSPDVRNNLGFYGPDIEVPKPAGVFRIVAFGDSTTYGLGTASSLAYPAQLERILRDEYGYTNVEVINAGVPGYTSWNHVVNLAFRALELEPDLILLYFATFDAQARLVDPDCYRGINAYRGLPPETGIWYPNGEWLGPSTLYRYVAINLGWMQNPLDAEDQIIGAISCDKPNPDPEVALVANPPVYFERNIRTMIGIAQAHGAKALLSTWTYDAAMPPDVRPNWWPGVVVEHNDVIRKVAQDTDTLFYDLAVSDFSTIPEYWFGDYLHQSIEGHTEQARRYAAYLVEAGVLPPP